MHIKRVAKAFVPPAIPLFKSHLEIQKEKRLVLARRQRFEGLTSKVSETILAIKSLTEAQCRDARFLEKEFIPSIGLNDETLHEQPQEFASSFGKGLHIWQYPNQLAAYLVWLSTNVAGITSYMEIGPRWGGMLILVSEWIRKNGADLRAITAVDPILPTPFINTYFQLLQDEPVTLGGKKIETTYIREFSTSQTVASEVERIRPDFVFVDGDHSLRVAFADHLLARKYARIVAHHDICSQSCQDTTFLWNALKNLEAPTFDCFEFDAQYPSVEGNFLGIGAMRRKTTTV